MKLKFSDIPELKPLDPKERKAVIWHWRRSHPGKNALLVVFSMAGYLFILECLKRQFALTYPDTITPRLLLLLLMCWLIYLWEVQYATRTIQPFIRFKDLK